ncbi:MAG: PKD domain-containing protein [Candidatus Hydrogenedens sp.]|nr:PKD domain-containing protein [Candidatus Hydrogenedens sp.]
MRSLVLRASMLLLLCAALAAVPGCPPAKTPPAAGFTAAPTSGVAPLQVQFTDTSVAGSSGITGWSWNFGDGGTSTETNPAHLYATAGTYTVTLTVTSADGNDTETRTNLVTVTADPNWAADTATFEVDIAPEVQLVEEADLGDVLLALNAEEHAYLLDRDAANAMGLNIAVGAPLVLAGIEVGRISRADFDPAEIYIETETIPLNEVFPDGDIAWDYGVEFTPDTVKSIEIPGVGEYPVKAGTPIEITFEQGGLKYELKATLDVTTADFDFTVTKGVGAGVKARFTATGQFARFRNQNQIKFESGQLQQFQHELKGLRGQTDLKLVVAGSGSDAVDLKLPVPIMKIPFVVGYIPAVLEVGAQFVVNAAVPLDGSAQVGTSFTYNSDLGFSFNGTTVQAGGRAGTTTFGDAVHQTGASSAISANFGIGYPRVSLSIAGGTLVPWAQTAFLVGGSYTFMPACQTADAQFIGAAGYDLGILGFSLASGSTKLFEQKKELLRAGQCTKSDAFDWAAEALAGNGEE